jgi:viroplasmin and RNaseH domain-containing protein
MQRFQTSVSDKLKEIQKATPSRMDPLEVAVKPKARKKVKGLAPKFFAVAVGRQPGIYTTWAEAKAQVDLYPHSQVQTFKSEAAAVRYLSVMAERHSSSDEGTEANNADDSNSVAENFPAK